MLTVRLADDRGHFDHGWLDTRHTFSFAEYRDPSHMGFRTLRVLNEDRVQPGAGFPTHAHRDMEILSYVLAGRLAHRDSLGNGSVIVPGEVQRMTAGTGVTHSEANPSGEEPVHFLQVWIIPERTSLAPGYEQRAFPEAERRGRLRLVASRDGAEGSLTVHQDVRVFAGSFERSESATHRLAKGRHAWLQVARGQVRVNGQQLSAGDGAGISGEPEIRVEGAPRGEVLVFDLA
jgi:redox-sensitive bicupin YhaK (pirin superfamily)